MRKLILLALLACCSSPAWATWSLVKANSNNGCSVTASCTVTVTSTGAGHLLVAGIMSNANMTISSVTCTGCTGGSAFTLCGSTCQNGDATAGWVDMAYALSSASGVTSVVINHTSISNNTVGIVLEFSFTASSSIFDNSNNVLQTTNCTSCTGAALTIGGTNDVMVTIASCGGTCSAITTYTADLTFPGGDAVGHLLNSTSGTAPTFTQSPTSHIAVAALAIKEASSSSPTAVPMVF